MGGLTLTQLNVDGGMTANNLLMQMQADLLGVDVVRPDNAESTSWGAAIAAGIADGVGVWHLESIHEQRSTQRFESTVQDEERDDRYRQWRRAVSRSLGWIQSTSQRDQNKGPAEGKPDMTANGVYWGPLLLFLTMTGLTASAA